METFLCKPDRFKMEHIPQTDAERNDLSYDRSKCFAPLIPICGPKIKIGSRIVFTIAPTSIDVIEYRGLPSARISLLIPVFAIRNGKPIAVIRVYSCAYGSTSDVAPKNFSIGVRKIVVTAKVQSRKLPSGKFHFPHTLQILFLLLHQASMKNWSHCRFQAAVRLPYRK